MKKVVFCAAMLLAVTFVLSCFASCGTVSTVVEGGGEKQGEDQGKEKGDPGIHTKYGLPKHTLTPLKAWQSTIRCSAMTTMATTSAEIGAEIGNTFLS